MAQPRRLQRGRRSPLGCAATRSARHRTAICRRIHLSVRRHTAGRRNSQAPYENAYGAERFELQQRNFPVPQTPVTSQRTTGARRRPKLPSLLPDECRNERLAKPNTAARLEPNHRIDIYAPGLRPGYFIREPGPTTYPSPTLPSIRNIADQQQHSANTCDVHTDGRHQLADSPDENGDISHG